MNDAAEQNKRAWEHRAYEFWCKNNGTPQEKAAEILRDPAARLRHHRAWLEQVQGLRIANPCGSNGRIAVPLALLGAEVTVFDLSEENRRYALELAACAGVPLGYVLGDFCAAGEQWSNCFDLAYLEGGILHYFHDLDRFYTTLHRILKPGGRLLLSDFHPLRKVLPVGNIGKSAAAVAGDYFDSGIHRGDVAYKSFFTPEEQASFPDCSLRFYTLADILNGLLGAGFRLLEFHEHPHWDDSRIPGEFTLLAAT